MSKLKYLYFLLILIFVSFAVVQFNDPDPLIWILLYLLPIYLIYQKLFYRGSKKYFVVIGIIYFLWAVNQYPPTWEGLLLNGGMKTINIELGRESLGLGFTAIIIWILSFIDK